MKFQEGMSYNTPYGLVLCMSVSDSGVGRFRIKSLSSTAKQMGWNVGEIVRCHPEDKVSPPIEECWTEVMPKHLQDRQELLKLRVSLARVAQLCMLDKHIPGCGNVAEANYNTLMDAAEAKERGWNALAGRITSVIEELNWIKKDRQKMMSDLDGTEV